MARQKDRNFKVVERSVRIWKAGIYTRISVDRYEEKKDSLATQKMIAKAYIENTEDIEIVNYYEDDGISGTKFDRDDFVRMLNDIKSGVIDTVIVKDLSRFGRNLDEVSNYLEKIFPFMQVRFISINDNYDSNDPNCDEKMLGIMISNLANDMYAKDASKKATTTMKIRMKRGEYCGGYAPYGYKRIKDKNGMMRTEIDPLTAPYVKRIFERVATGESYSSISRSLNDMLLASPRIYARTGQLFVDNILTSESHWCVSQIRRMVENRHYLGDTYTHKTRTSLITLEKNTMLSKDEWYKHENTHEAIVDGNLFEKVQEIVVKRKEHTISKNLIETPISGKKENKYLGILKCGECGAQMTRRTNKKTKDGMTYYRYYFLCQNYANVSRTAYTSNRWSEDILDQLVYNAIMSQISLADDLRISVIDFNKNYYEPYFKMLEREQLKLKQLLEKNEMVKFDIYEKYAMGDISEGNYNEEIQRIECVKTEFAERLNEIDYILKTIRKLKKENLLWLQEFIKGHETKMLTKEVISTYIEEIRLYENKRMEIVFKFQDEMIKLAECLKESEELCQHVSV